MARQRGPIMSIDRKAAIAAYKERKTRAGIFAVRCAATGQVWVGESRHVDTQQNGLWFSLKHGNYPNRALQAAWAAHGADAFGLEILECLPDEDLTPYLQGRLLQERGQDWRAQLAAPKI
jgi:hypothetical protein